MSVEPLDVSSLEIIGYANVLPQSALPSIVAPVFRRKDNHDSVLVPPYSFSNGRYLCDATEITQSEFESLENRSELTKLASPIPAQKQHELWVDLDGQYHYQTRLETKRRLERIAAIELEKALTAFLNREFEKSELYSSTVLLADENNTEALAIKIAIAKVNQDYSSMDTLRDLVPVPTLRSIDLRVDDLCGRINDTLANNYQKPHSSMHMMATIKSNPCYQ